MRKYQAQHYQEIKEYIDVYQASLTEEIQTSQEYSFRVYLLPKIGNHLSSSDIAVEFVKHDPENPEQFQGLEKQIVAIRNKTVQVVNQGKLKPKTVWIAAEAKIGRQFHQGEPLVLHK